MISGEEAAAIGLVTRTADDASAAALALAGEIVQKSAMAIRRAKRLYDEVWEASDVQRLATRSGCSARSSSSSRPPRPPRSRAEHRRAIPAQSRHVVGTIRAPRVTRGAAVFCPWTLSDSTSRPTLARPGGASSTGRTAPSARRSSISGRPMTRGRASPATMPGCQRPRGAHRRVRPHPRADRRDRCAARLAAGLRRCHPTGRMPTGHGSPSAPSSGCDRPTGSCRRSARSPR